ncbi:hypothetical protein BC826DRAFT_906637 [Russula brevipes]|nr:hypothetical protein BC826DRAFT_906637 [Russula brevipes]
MVLERNCLFPDTFYSTPLNTWAAAIQRAPLDAQNCLIDWVVHGKAKSNLEHEFLLVNAHHPSGAQITLGIDRYAERPPVAPEGATSTASSKSSGPGTSSSFSSFFSRNADDRVQVSHDGTPAPILEQQGEFDVLSSITFAQTATAGSDDDTDPRRPSLLQFSILLRTIRKHFPSYSLLEYQCYFFARATCLALIDLFGGVERELEEGRQRRGAVCTSLLSRLRARALLPVLLIASVEVATVPYGLWALYSCARLYGWKVVKNKDRHQIRCAAILISAGRGGTANACVVEVTR